jgi:hypothetical protein
MANKMASCGPPADLPEWQQVARRTHPLSDASFLFAEKIIVSTEKHHIEKLDPTQAFSRERGRSQSLRSFPSKPPHQNVTEAARRNNGAITEYGRTSYGDDLNSSGRR